MRIAKQPNDKYCIWDKQGNLHVNQTEDDYYNFALDEAREQFLMPGFIEGVNTIIQNVSDNKVLKDMGFQKPRSELIKYIPKLVTNQSYSPRDCETVGKCPNCGDYVYDGYGGTDLQCKTCGQHLKWRSY